MSQENVEFARSVFSRWNAGERSFPDEEIHPDVVLVSRILGKAVRGRAGVRRYLREIDEQFDEWTMAIEEWRDAGDCVRRHNQDLIGGVYEFADSVRQGVGAVSRLTGRDQQALGHRADS
jgi:ketosteroid isomerase-like protein